MTAVDERHDDGFTLIELMVVMLVIGILAGIVLLGLAQFRDDAVTSRDQANAKECAKAFAFYRANHDTDPTAWSDISIYIPTPPPGRCGLP